MLICLVCRSKEFAKSSSEIDDIQTLTCSKCGASKSLKAPALVASPEQPASNQVEDERFSEKIIFKAGSPGRRSILYGWGGPENWGSWANDEWAAIALSVPMKPCEIGFELIYRAPEETSPEEPVIVDLYAQERACGTFIVKSAEEGSITGRLPLTGLASGGRATIELHHLTRHRVEDELIGIGLIACRLFEQ